MNGISISVALCTHNGARFLSEQLESIGAQTLLPDELVICDDRSTDGSVEIIKAFARQASFKVRSEINERNLGATKNFEKAIGLCGGDVIALADQDDVWHSNKLERIAQVFMSAEDAAAVFSDAELIDQDSHSLDARLWNSFSFGTREQKRFTNGQAFDVLVKHPVVTGATMAFRKIFCGLVLPIPANHVHDEWISLLLAACGGFRPIPEVLMGYRQHASQQIGPGKSTLTLKDQIRVARKTGWQFYRSEIDRFREVDERLKERSDQFPHRAQVPGQIQEKISHRDRRASLLQSKVFLRPPLVLQELLNGRYWRYSGGWRSVAKDLLLSSRVSDR